MVDLIPGSHPRRGSVYKDGTIHYFSGAAKGSWFHGLHVLQGIEGLKAA